MGGPFLGRAPPKMLSSATSDGPLLCMLAIADRYEVVALVTAAAMVLHCPRLVCITINCSATHMCDILCYRCFTTRYVLSVLISVGIALEIVTISWSPTVMCCRMVATRPVRHGAAKPAA